MSFLHRLQSLSVSLLIKWSVKVLPVSLTLTASPAVDAMSNACATSTAVLAPSAVAAAPPISNVVTRKVQFVKTSKQITKIKCFS